MAFLLAKPTPLNVNHDNDRFSMFNKKRDIPPVEQPLWVMPRHSHRRFALEHEAVQVAPFAHVVVGVGLVNEAAIVHMIRQVRQAASSIIRAKPAATPTRVMAKRRPAPCAREGRRGRQTRSP
jgi:hypothetical protein